GDGLELREFQLALNGNFAAPADLEASLDVDLERGSGGFFVKDPFAETHEISTLGSLTATHLTVQNLSAANLGVPEPGAWALMILGFGAAGAALRRRSPILH